MRSRKEATQQMTIDVTTETYTHVSTPTTANNRHALGADHVDSDRGTRRQRKRPLACSFNTAQGDQASRIA